MKDEPYYCARCLCELPMGNTEEAWCDNCHVQIHGAEDYLTEAQMREKRARDHAAWDTAIACGLIVPKTGEAQ